MSATTIRRKLTFITGVLGLLAFAGCGTQSDATKQSDGELQLRLGFVGSEDYIGAEAVREFVEQASELSDGRISIKPFYNGVLGGEAEMLASVQDGGLDLALLASPIVATADPAFTVTDLPYIWESGEAMNDVLLDGPIGDDLLTGLKDEGLKGLGWVDWGPRNLLVTGKDAQEIADLEGLQVRVIENPMYVAMWDKFGVNAVPVPWPETFTSLQQGVVDGVDTTAAAMRLISLEEVGDTLLVTEHIRAAAVLIADGEFWDGLSQKDQEILTQAAEMAEQANRAAAPDVNEQEIAAMVDAGVTVVELDQSRLADMTSSVRESYADKIGSELLQRAQELQGDQ